LVLILKHPIEFDNRNLESVKQATKCGVRRKHLEQVVFSNKLTDVKGRNLKIQNTIFFPGIGMNRDELIELHM
jgi:hypothetical protein